ncbi:MAG: HAD-IIB family hydrolase [Planctomycetales bacterium]|nr:HAD-IIB family hydrolase [Planctomycetales bacterium]
MRVSLISLHGLIRADGPELGRDADTGGQIKYVLEAARELAAQPEVTHVELLTRQIVDARVDPAYARLEEPISDKASIVRIPFGPNRYLRKESLWPFIEMFIDQALAHFRRVGLPDVIHGHYADAGFAGAQLARLLHVPFVFTGHSLGRVKQQRMSLGKSNASSLESRYKFATRIEAEEVALETAAMVVTSTNQEVEQQYALYDHYVPSRMEVIPPGVDLQRFTPYDGGDVSPTIDASLRRFLREPDKPLVLAMARPDERKNLSTLVRVYGQSEELRQLANLALFMGTRESIKELPSAQREVVHEILRLIDYYDLYGKVAYPKTHTQDDVPEIYRYAAAKRGVFVNPALTEPFGLTLLEAGAAGLPIVATNDGGPRDIIANCQHGLLIDPLDDESIEHALVRTLTNAEEWDQWSRNGVAGTREHYSWSSHASRYLRDLRDILDHSPPPSLSVAPRSRRLPEFDRLILTDLDDTLTGDAESLGRFAELLRANDHVGFGIATGRRLDSALELLDELGLPRPDLISTDVGTQLHYGPSLTPDLSWEKAIGYAWRPDEIRAALSEMPGLHLQSDTHQSRYKISFEMDTEQLTSPAPVRQFLRERGLRAKVVASRGMYLDVLPVRGGSDLAVRHILWKWGFAAERILVAGDSGNDEGMLLGRTLGVVVGNHSPELAKLRKRPRIYFANASRAAGVLEGVDYYQFLDNITIPNDRIE